MKLADFVHSNKLKKCEFDERLPGLRAELLEVQNSLRTADFPVIVLFAGVDGAGKSEVVNLLNEWMDPRWLINHAYGRPSGSDSDTERPAFRRYWKDVPPRGQIGLFLSAWYSQVLLGTVAQRVPPEQFPRHAERIRRFERTLANDGALILKFWMHLDKRKQKKQLTRLEANPATAWRVTHTDWAHWAMYDRFVQAGDQIIDATDTKLAPWRVVDGVDHRYRSITIAQHMLDAIKKRLNDPNSKQEETNATTDVSSSEKKEPSVPKPVKSDFEASRVNWFVWRGPQTNVAQKRIPKSAGSITGRIESTVSPGETTECFESACVRGLGCGGQGGRDPPDIAGTGPKKLPRHSDRRANRRRTCKALLVAILASHPQRGKHHDL